MADMIKIPDNLTFDDVLGFVDFGENYNFSVDEFLNVADQFSSDNRWFSPNAETAIIATFSLLIVVGLLCNGVVFYIIARKGSRQSSRNWYILNMAGSDILTCAICAPLTVVRLVMKNWFLGQALCKMVTSLQCVYVCVSTFTLVALAGDRYCAIVYNKHQANFKRCVCACISLIWIASFCISSPMVYVHDIEHVTSFNGNIMWSLCLEKWESETLLTVYTILLLLIQYLSPLIAIVVIHLIIVRFLKSRFQACCVDDANIRRKRRRHQKNIFLLSSMAISFGVAWFPLHIINALAYIDYNLFLGMPFPLIYAVCVILAFTSVCLNPIIYGLLNSNFRRDLVKMCVTNHSSPPPGRLSAYTDITRRSSPNVEHMGLIASAHTELGFSNTQLYRVRNGAAESNF
ncbi:neuropeptide y receptor type 1 [Plakobranchus ocellatus]|uniref:Neuropeptide y receptor type 1 n=1 Tax=Plakobranchus ocellatus TaxID=259542 RepID=A0AAV4CYW6_9GAST|nr:neuropeptide y receptor type 1 [Plakobranchus ocellatus]